MPGPIQKPLIMFVCHTFVLFFEYLGLSKVFGIVNIVWRKFPDKRLHLIQSDCIFDWFGFEILFSFRMMPMNSDSRKQWFTSRAEEI